MDMKKICSGFKTSGHWKGYPCVAIAKYKYKGKWYCKNHLPIPEPSERSY